jgi:large subunit ribosomal protein L15
MDLSNLRPAPGAIKKRKRLGRGPGSGLGKTSGKGHKGKGARSGGNTPPGYEGGQMPMARRLPKRGFRNLFRKEYRIVNLGSLDRFAPNTLVDLTALQEAGLIRKKHKKVKILAKGELTKPLTIKVQAYSQQAREKVIALGGAIEVG